MLLLTSDIHAVLEHRRLLPATSTPTSAPEPDSLHSQDAASAHPDSGKVLGLSYEVKDLALVASLADKGNYVSLLRSLGPGMLLRFSGGPRADSQVAWLDPASAPLPSWATTALTPADLYRLADLARATGCGIVLTLNLVHFDPAAAADEARVARQHSGSSLQAIKIGNEPTAYVSEHLRTRFSFTTYAREIVAYRRDITAAVPGLPIDGPDNEPMASNPQYLAWARATVRQLRPAGADRPPLRCRAMPAHAANSRTAAEPPGARLGADDTRWTRKRVTAWWRTVLSRWTGPTTGLAAGDRGD